MPSNDELFIEKSKRLMIINLSELSRNRQCIEQVFKCIEINDIQGMRKEKWTKLKKNGKWKDQINV